MIYITIIDHKLFALLKLIVSNWTFLKKFIYFTWRLTLQYFGGFWHTSTWISHGCTRTPPSWTPLLPPSPSCPSWLSQSIGFKCSTPCIEITRVINFTNGNIHVSKLLCQIIPPSPSPIVQKSVLYICVSFAVLHIGLSLKIPYICINILCWCFSFWLTSLCIMGSSFTHLIRTDSNAFFFYSWVIFHCVCVPLLPYPFTRLNF